MTAWTGTRSLWRWSRGFRTNTRSWINSTSPDHNDKAMGMAKCYRCARCPRRVPIPVAGGGGWLAVLDAKQRLVLPNGTGPDTIRKIAGWNDKRLAIGTCGAHRQLFSLPVS